MGGSHQPWAVEKALVEGSLERGCPSWGVDLYPWPPNDHAFGGETHDLFCFPFRCESPHLFCGFPINCRPM